MTDREAQLAGVLERARGLGFLGPGPIGAQLEHGRGFALVLSPPTAALDLGSGGGVPALVLAVTWPDATFVLVESNQRRSKHLVQAVEELGLEDRVRVLHERAEIVARDPRHREQYDLVTARGFGEPAVTAEIGSGLVVPSGSLVVSEPPDPRPERWPASPLRDLGFAEPTFSTSNGAHFVRLRKVSAAPETAPRAVGRPTKRPLW